MTTATGSPDYVLQIDMWGFNTHETYSIPNEHARAKYNTFKVKGDYYELEVEIRMQIFHERRNGKAPFPISICRLEIMSRILMLHLLATC